MPLSEFKISKAKKQDKAYKLPDGGGLFLLVKPNRSKLWQQKCRYVGKERILSHGQYPDVSLAQARTKRNEARALVVERDDPSHWVLQICEALQGYSSVRDRSPSAPSKVAFCRFYADLSEATLTRMPSFLFGRQTQIYRESRRSTDR